MAWFFCSGILSLGCGREEPPKPALVATGGAERRAAPPPGRDGPPARSEPSRPLAVDLIAHPRRAPNEPPGAKPPPDPLGLKKRDEARRPAGLALTRPRPRSPAVPAEREQRPAPPPDGHPSRPGESVDSQQDGSLKPGVPGSRYLSPARPKEGKVAEPKVAAATETVAARTEAKAAALDAKPGEAEPPSAKGLNADIMNAVVDPLEVGSYRVQVSDTEDFKAVLFDRTFAFLESQEVEADLRRSLPKGGKFWVRHAFIDLLEFQHPYSVPKRYRFRPRR